ncbi:MAG: PorV/PorQ family protein [Candidatus Marinimicrobia bacterium]|jgi:hypothetical protein|nr:PorV/PorQ family protein [Candidatus Neomarinimicrobiota bacterium]|tara:strand:+ start:776 stop:1840 length:1065 start_codon:yes stop_codon:yes gene_type:complete
MKNNKIKIFLSSVFLIGTLSAGTIKSQGQAGATQLLIPVGALSIATSGANGATVLGVDALYLNPAGIAGFMGGFQGTASTMNYIADIDIFNAGFVTNLGASGSFGLSVKSLDFGDIPVTTAQATEGTGEMFSPNFQTVTATYAKSFADRVRFGVSFKLVSEQIVNTKASGTAIDMGVQYRFANYPLAIGVTLSNLGNRMEYQGSDLEQTMKPGDSESGSSVERFRVKGEAFDLPAKLNVSLNYAAMDGLNLMWAFTNNSFSANTQSFAAKYSFGPAWVAGGMETRMVGDSRPSEITQETWDEAVSESQNNLFGATFGAGVSVPVGGMKLDISYSTRSLARYFDSNQVMQMSIEF